MASGHIQKTIREIGALLVLEGNLALNYAKTGERKVYVEKERRWYDHE